MYKYVHDWLCWGLTTRQHVGHFVSSPREREKWDRRVVEEMKERDMEERETGMKVKKQKKWKNSPRAPIA